MSQFRERLQRSPLCRRFGIDYPIVQAGMGGVAGGALAAAVSNAGGLGMIGAGFLPADAVAREIAIAKRATSKPFGINLLFVRAGGDDPISARYRRLFEDQMAVVLASDIPILVSGLGNPAEYIAAARARGMTVMSVVGNVAQARKLEAAGVDLIVAQGVDGGGHVGRVGTVVLVPAVIDAVKVPVLAAGGIADAQAVAGALARGAAGVWVGTRFVASHESAAHPLYKQKLLESTAADTVLTTVFDLDWPNAAHRVLRNSTVRAWEAAGHPNPARRPGEGEIIARLPGGEPVLRYSDQVPIADTRGDVEAMALYAGTGVGSIHDIRSAGEILFELAQATR